MTTLAEQLQTVRRPLEDKELLFLQQVMVSHFGGETPEVVEAVRLFSRRPDLTPEFVLRAYGIKVP